MPYLKSDRFHLMGATTSPAPLIEAYVPETRPNAALVIYPGGGYGHLAEHEGRCYAEHFRDEGFACFVVSYRLGTAGFRHPAMLEDALTAVGSVRSAAG
ncbi:MAG: hypothetical protein HQL31_04175 [Planctomycetes bacterium]|nr:hypothetical protein [Planctomycetota bacterium]